MIELDGIEYTIQTPEENATELTAFINNYCAQNNIRNTKGELISIEANKSNPLYMLLFGVSYLASVLQKLIFSAGCALNIPRCSERQLLNLCDIAMVHRRNATKTTVVCVLYTGEFGSVPSMHVTTDLSVTVLSGSTSVVFHPAYEVTIPIGVSLPVMFIAEQEGSFAIPANALTKFDQEVPGFRKMESNASIPGQRPETIAELRQRMQARAISGTQADRAAQAIEELDGVSLCSVYFNYSAISDTIVNGVSVPPRQALITVQGYSDKIAETFYAFMSCETAGAGNTRAIQQSYITNAGQQLTVNILTPITTILYIRVYVGQVTDAMLIQNIRDSVARLSLHQTIGKGISDGDIINQLHEDIPTLKVLGSEVSKDGVSYSYRQSATVDELLLFSTSLTEIIEATS